MKNITTYLLCFVVSYTLLGQNENQYVTDIAYLPEIVVKSTNTQASLDLYSVNVLDYRVFGESILSLKKEKGHYYLGIEHKDKVGENYNLSIKKPRSIFVDCFKNIHVLTDHEAYQIYITDEVKIVEAVPISIFNETVKKCRGELDKSIVLDEITNLNQKYNVRIYSKNLQDSKLIYSMTDSVMLKSMEQLELNDGKGAYRYWSNYIFGSSVLPIRPTFLHYRSNYIRSTGIVAQSSNDVINYSLAEDRQLQMNAHNVYIQDRFYGNYRTPASNSVDFFEKMRARYIDTKKIQINTFTIGDTIVIIDQLNSLVNLFYQNGELIQTKPLVFSGEIEEILQNPSNGALYITSQEDELYKVHRIDVETGNTIYGGGFKNISLTRTRKIYDGWIYYRVMRNGFYKLYRTRLKA